MSDMETSRKIMLLGLPSALHGALAELLERSGLLANGMAEADAVITADAEAGNDVPRALPVLVLRAGRKARIGTLLRQARHMVEEPALFLDPFSVGPFLFSPQDKRLSREGEEDIALTDKEVDILVCLARQSPAPVPREALLKNVWRYQDGVDTHTLETHIYRLRQKMEKSADDPQILVTEGKGYRIV